MEEANHVYMICSLYTTAVQLSGDGNLRVNIISKFRSYYNRKQIDQMHENSIGD